MKKEATVNAKYAKFNYELHMPNYYCGIFKVFLRRHSKSKEFFDRMDEQIPNQLLYNLEEREGYFLNEDKNLFRLKFEPVIMKKKKQYNPDMSTEEYTELLKKNYLKDEIRELAIPWSKFYWPDARWANEKYSLGLLTYMFIDLLDLVKETTINIECGIGMMHLLNLYPLYDTATNKIDIGGCKIIPELNFNLEKYDLSYNGITVVGSSITEKEETKETSKENTKQEQTPKKKFFGFF